MANGIAEHDSIEASIAKRSPLSDDFNWRAFTRTRRAAWIVATLLPALVGPIWYLVVRSAGHSLLGAVAGAVLVLLVLTCAYTDVRSRKIPNWATYIAFLWALAINSTASMTGQVVEEGIVAQSVHGFASIGPVGVEQSL